MDDRIVEFIAALRAAGVRVSIAESEDSFRAIQQLGVINKAAFRAALRTTLVKDIRDFPEFDRLFPLYFGGDAPLNALAGMNPHDREMLEAALEEMSRQLADRLRRLLIGQGLTREELQRIAQAAAQARDLPPELRFWLMRQLQRELGLDQLQRALQELWRQLRAAGMTPETLA
ncbi:MAG: CoxE, partial [Chloroflexota bacterium]